MEALGGDGGVGRRISLGLRVYSLGYWIRDASLGLRGVRAAVVGLEPQGCRL